MPTISRNQWEINGVIDTNNNVIDNLNQIAEASGCFFTWDSGTGTWSVIINDVTNPSYSFDEDNIIGNITVSGSGINELYNSSSIEFPHKDIRDKKDYIDLKIALGERFDQELDNRLTIRTSLVNDPIQAQRIASRLLKQSRVDKIVRFRTDFAANQLQAGEVFDITAPTYGFFNKLFRIIEITETDDESGNLFYEITGLEYDDDVYTTQNLVRTKRSKKTGIVPKSQNTALTQSDNEQTVNQFANLIGSIGLPAFLAILNSFSDGETTEERQSGIPLLTYGSQNFSTTEVETAYNLIAGTPTGTFSGFNGSGDNFNDGIFGGFNLSVPYKAVQITVTMPQSRFDFYRRINGADDLKTDVVAYIPTQIDVYAQIDNQFSKLATYTSDWQSNTITLILENTQPGLYFLNLFPLLTYDLDQEQSVEIFPFNHEVLPNSNGAGITFTTQAFTI